VHLSPRIVVVVEESSFLPCSVQFNLLLVSFYSVHAFLPSLTLLFRPYRYLCVI